jgi:hypothetical protein
MPIDFKKTEKNLNGVNANPSIIDIKLDLTHIIPKWEP